MSLGFTPPPVTGNMTIWAQNLVSYLRRTVSRLQFKGTGASAVEDGVMLWDAAGGYPVVSKSNEWRQIVLSDGQYMGGVATDQTAAAANTAYKLTYTAGAATGIANDGTHPERIVFAEGGEYLINFSAQISSGASASVDFYFWPRVNGVDDVHARIRVIESVDAGAAGQNAVAAVASRNPLVSLVAHMTSR